MNVSFLQELLGSIAEQSRQLLPRSLRGAERKADIDELAAALLSGRGEASGVAIASAILASYRALEPHERRQFLGFLADSMQPDARRCRASRASLSLEPRPGGRRQAAAGGGKPAT